MLVTSVAVVTVVVLAVRVVVVIYVVPVTSIATKRTATYLTPACRHGFPVCPAVWISIIAILR